MLKRWLDCGKIVATHGVRGDVKVEPWCDSPEDLLRFPMMYLGAEKRPLVVEKARVHGGMVLLKIVGYDTPETAAALRGGVLYLDRADVPMAEGEFFVQDLIGLDVFDADTGALYGQLCDVSQTGANGVYHIRFDDGKVRLVPVIPQVVTLVDPLAGRIEIRPLPGLFDDGEAVEE